MRKLDQKDVLWWTLILALWVTGATFVAASCEIILQGRWTRAAVDIAVGLLLFGASRMIIRWRRGWIIDDNGERQKVERWNRGHAIFKPTTRTKRIIEEARTKAQRRKDLVWYGLAVAGFYGGAAYIWVTHQRGVGLGGLLFWPLIVFGLAPLGVWLAGMADEILYLSGWQDMTGAKVLDAEPIRPGLADVMNQKVHGEGRVATLPEALNLLDPQR
jgi:hypothetical protein